MSLNSIFGLYVLIQKSMSSTKHIAWNLGMAVGHDGVSKVDAVQSRILG